ncbi:MAG TPA: hypothetical protein VGK10_03920 [Prolixibacteraceae bacterium]|jgi:hypothetical protein
MKTSLLVLALALTISLSGFASSQMSSVANTTEHVAGTKTNHSTGTKKAALKKPHAKKHHKITGSKKAQVVK